MNWFQVVPPEAWFSDLGDHAGEMETSTMLHIAPHFVLSPTEAGSGHENRFTIPALRERWAWTPRQWKRASDDTGIGNPAEASTYKGATYLAQVTGRIGEFLGDLARTRIEDLYEKSEWHND